MSSPSALPDETRILILTPLADDRAALGALLSDEGDVADAPAADLAALLRDGLGCVILTEDMLTPEVTNPLLGWAQDQPAWSAMPVLLLCCDPAHLPRPFHHLADPGAPLGLQLTLLPRPCGPDILRNAVRNALGSRRRQYQLRDQIAELAQREAKVRLLGREVQHRAKNSLAKLTAILHQTWRSARGPEHFIASFERRVQAMSRGLNLMSDSEWQGARLADLFVSEAQAALGPGGRKRLICNGPDVLLSNEGALALHLVIHELTTNAVKYGAFSTEEGRVHSSWQIRKDDRGDRLHIHWQERDGPEVTGAPAEKGFGSTLIERALTFEADGAVRLDFPADGVSCTIDLPLQEILQPAD